MSSILETLGNAEININNGKRVGPVAILLAHNQLHNAVVLLEKGYGLDDDVDSLLEQHGKAEDAPDMDD